MPLMKQQVPDEDFIKRYLLGELPEDARQQIEERLISDDEFYKNYITAEDVVEDDLIDRYVGGEMSERERERFDRIFLSTRQRFEKLRLAQSLQDYVNSPTPDPQTHSPPLLAVDSAAPRDGIIRGPVDLLGVEEAAPWWRSTAAFQHGGRWFVPLAFVLLLAVGTCAGLLYLKAGRLEKELAELRARQQPQPTPDQHLQGEVSDLRARNDELAEALRRAEEQRAATEQRLASLEARGRQTTPVKTRPAQADIPTLALALINVRGEGGGTVNTVNLTPGAAGIRLLLGLDTVDPSDYRDFRAEVSIRGGAAVWSPDRLRAGRGDEPRVTLIIPAGRLSGGDYVVRLSGRSKDGVLSLIGVYDFRVTRE